MMLKSQEEIAGFIARCKVVADTSMGFPSGGGMLDVVQRELEVLLLPVKMCTASRLAGEDNTGEPNPPRSFCTLPAHADGPHVWGEKRRRYPLPAKPLSRMTVTQIQRATMLVELAMEEMREEFDGEYEPGEFSVALGAARESLMLAHASIRPLYAMTVPSDRAQPDRAPLGETGWTGLAPGNGTRT